MSLSMTRTSSSKLFLRLTRSSRSSFPSLSLSPWQQQQQQLTFPAALEQQQQQWRSMVVITKTSPADLDTSAVPQDSGAPNNNFNEIVNLDDRLIVTPSCVKQIHTLLKRRDKSPDEMFLRVFVDAGGCSGFSYKFEMDDELVEEEDVIFEPQGSNGARVVCDEASLDLIRGSKIDYVQEMIKSAFEVKENPQSESACGCGSSFAVKNFAANPALD